MLDNSDYVMRPCEHGMCSYESLKDGTLTLVDVRRMNENLDVRVENHRRMKEHLRRGD